jgi:hypothetical protein
LLRATGLAAVTDVLLRVKSHYPVVDKAKVKGGATPRWIFKPWILKLKRLSMK